MSKPRIMTQLTPELEARINKMKKKARAYIAKSEVLQFRLDEPTYLELFTIAERKHKPVGTLVRDWVTGLVREEIAAYRIPANHTKKASRNTLAHLQSLQRQIDELKRKVG